MAEEIKARLIERIKRTESVQSFRFMPQKKIFFYPGQFLQIIFDESDKENKELNKYLSLSCSPDKEYIEVTKRMSQSAFSQRLMNLKINDEVLVKMPMGNCVFKDEYQKIGFLIGGIGITPVISIIEYIMDKQLSTDVHLVYSNRSEDDIPFRPELGHWQAMNQNIKVDYTITGCQPKDRTCLFGFISKKLLQERGCDLSDRIVFIFGPPKMVDEICNITLQLECKQENLRTERFIGY